MTDLPEPPDHAVVGWGLPIRGARVRIDEYADKDENRRPHLERWFDISDNNMDEPISWITFVNRIRASGHEPNLLSPAPLK